MRRTLLLLTAAALLFGCTTPKAAPPSVPHSPESVYRQPSPPPAGAPPVHPIAGGWTIRQVHPAGYLWREGGGALAFRDASGIWSVSADGKSIRPAATGDAERELLRYSAEGLLYLEKGPGGVFLWQWRPEGGGKMVAQLAPAGAPDALWRVLAADRLLFALPGKRISTVDVSTGAVKELAGEAPDVVNGEFAVSRDGRYLIYKLANRGDPIRVIDLQTGATKAVPGEAHLTGAAWSPAEARWAVRAAEPGSGLPRPVGANLEEGATHVDVGTPAGEVRHLRPPERVNLTAGPWWSPDGKRLAFMAEPPEERQAGPVWIADVATGTWTKLKPSEPFWVTGWTPDGRYLTTQRAGFRLPVDGGALVKGEEIIEQVRLPDGSTVDLLKDGKVTHRGAQLLAPEPGLRERLTVAGTNAALFMTRAGEPTDLIVLQLK